MSGISRSQLTFELERARLLLTGVVCGIAVAIVGGALAAIKAARIPIADGPG